MFSVFKDVFVWLPTGFGKMVCFEALMFMFDIKLSRVGSLVVVVSPLVSLIIDQVRSLRSREMKAAVISSGSGGAFQGALVSNRIS